MVDKNFGALDAPHGLKAPGSQPDGTNLWTQPKLDGWSVPLPPGTPKDLEVRHHAPKPLLATDADLATPLGNPENPSVSPDGSGRPHRLVTIGDSITQGFQSFAIHNTGISWPKMVADAFGFDFSHPEFNGPEAAPGLPLNLEALTRGIEAAIRERPLPFEAPHVLTTAIRMLEEVRHYWERGAGSNPLSPAQTTFHENLAIWGWDVRDALSKDRAWCQRKVDTHQDLLSKLHISNDLMVSHSKERTALRTLWNASQEGGNVTQISAAKTLGADNGGAGIDTLVVALGANNALGSIGTMKITWSDDGYKDVDKKSKYNVWTPEHFRVELHELATKVGEINAAHTLWLTVPHVTVLPLVRGVGEKPYYSRYFARYTRPWISDADFDANIENCLTGDDARLIDAAIDQYKWAIKQRVHDERTKGNDWYVVDLCGLLDRVAYRRYLASPQSRPYWWEEVKLVLPAELLAMSPRPDTRFFSSDQHGRTQGGLIALDGVHPTTIGYGLIAREVLEVMTLAGVKPMNSNPASINFKEILDKDTLNSHPPEEIGEDLEMIGLFNRAIDIVEVLLGKKPI
ncbi:hypothetical protein [Arthrobacter sp. B2a2-09]|uniref:hypothetical protein n=1 Tax=Arthrobacter sp. B2a2-09 TaxID=2952822 RepID=UPI0022CD4A38|nr:hypothetical protein [Arthrobacter sp. B2a2-09]MCZ9881674.1 hypothetical protein [Arthrobacter sp. B2a2-09]